MDRRRFIATAAGATAGVALGGLAHPVRAEGERPNLLLIMTDQQRADAIHASGNPDILTPSLDRLAAGGANFTRHYTAAFPCSPSRATLLSGRYSHSHGVWTNDVLFDPDIPTLGSVARTASYDTGWIGKWHLGGRMYGEQFHYRYTVTEEGLQREQVALDQPLGEDVPQHGFGHWVGGWTHYQRYLRERGLGEYAEGAHPLGCHRTAIEDNHSVIPEDDFMSAFLAKEAITYLRQPQRRERPFALCLSFYGPHLSITPPQPWDQMYPRDQVPLPGNLNDDLSTKPVRNQQRNQHWMRKQWSDDDYRDIIARYYGYVSYLDKWIGEVLDTLDEQGLADNTIVVFTSDHGEMIGSHGFIYKGAYMYDEVQRVPLVVRMPGVVQAGLQSEALSSSVDVLPTLLAMMGLPAPGGVQGRSFLPLLTGASPSYRDAVFTEMNSAGLGIAMMRDDHLKLCYNWKPRQVDELYDMQTDALELTNLAEEPAHARTAGQMCDEVLAWMRETGDPLAGVAGRARDEEVSRPVDVAPEVTACEYLGGNRLRFTYQWKVNDPVAAGTRGFVQFTHPQFGQEGAGDIAFRIVSWPQTPAEQWQPGNTYPMPVGEVEIPAWAGAGTYGVRIGLYNVDPEKRPMLVGGTGGNSMVVGTLTIQRDGDLVTAASFHPTEANPAPAEPDQ